MLPLLALSAAASPLDAVALLVQAEATCAGTFIAPDTVLTAYHCVVQGGSVRVQTQAGDVGRGRVIRWKVSDDLAVLHVEGVGAPAVMPLASASPDVGAPVQALGHPYGSEERGGYLESTLRWSTSEGMVSALGERALQVTAPINPGNSGGPLVNEHGELVAVVSRHIEGDGLGFGTRVERVHELMARPERPHLSPLGGTANVIGTSSTTSIGTLTAGAGLELILRDRVAARATGSEPLTKRWDALERGELRWVSWEAQVAVRQRLFEGAATHRLELSGGVLQQNSYAGTVLDNQVRFTASAPTLLPTVGAALYSGSTGVAIAYLPTADTDRWLLSVRLNLTGQLGMF